ncbi:MAG: dihydropteroate synthase [Paludisphaera borealis]|uniref:dihydropteroate synthase n=1 Tax=Paludisphaera borealis TaxID=1387353 RepID=UPI00284A24D3|nr:dihydropteroate synthase [Paludisphaera borealis]MDR3619801.1 dihydropteroate synthase [Paludisphaera borealis]
MFRRWEARGRLIADGSVPKVMGIVNVTPDSFSDGGRWFSTDAAVAHGLKLVEDGADLLDVGGESTRPGAEIVSIDDEQERVVPVIERLARETGVPISIDTTKPEVARQAMLAGASIVNDVSALREPGMVEVVSSTGAAVVLMHMQGTPQTMQDDPRYDDVVAEVRAYLVERIAWCEARGIPRSRIAVDPGIGFGKSFEHNMALLRNLDQFANLNSILLIGISRKGLLKKITGRGMAQRSTSSVVCSLAGCRQGARVVRVHDVGPMVDAIRVWNDVIGWESNDG